MAQPRPLGERRGTRPWARGPEAAGKPRPSAPQASRRARASQAAPIGCSPRRVSPTLRGLGEGRRRPSRGAPRPSSAEAPGRKAWRVARRTDPGARFLPLAARGRDTHARPPLAAPLPSPKAHPACTNNGWPATLVAAPKCWPRGTCQAPGADSAAQPCQQGLGGSAETSPRCQERRARLSPSGGVSPAVLHPAVPSTRPLRPHLRIQLSAELPPLSRHCRGPDVPQGGCSALPGGGAGPPQAWVVARQDSSLHPQPVRRGGSAAASASCKDRPSPGGGTSFPGVRRFFPCAVGGRGGGESRLRSALLGEGGASDRARSPGVAPAGLAPLSRVSRSLARPGSLSCALQASWQHIPAHPQPGPRGASSAERAGNGREPAGRPNRGGFRHTALGRSPRDAGGRGLSLPSARLAGGGLPDGRGVLPSAECCRPPSASNPSCPLLPNAGSFPATIATVLSAFCNWEPFGAGNR